MPPHFDAGYFLSPAIVGTARLGVNILYYLIGAAYRGKIVFSNGLIKSVVNLAAGNIVIEPGTYLKVILLFSIT